MQMTHENSLSDRQVNEFLDDHHLPDSVRQTIVEHYLPLASWLYGNRQCEKPLLLGINGAQGTGKSTLAEFLRLVLESNYGWRVAVLSIDDFYFTRAEREALSRDVHPLLITRGVPGTHDMQMLSRCLQKLKDLKAGREMALPRFDKARDDRADSSAFPIIRGPVDIIILEGWCVGSRAQGHEQLRVPINALEQRDDADGVWRNYVNDQLMGDYAEVFASLDLLVFLKMPDFSAVFRWRLEQEQKLADTVSAEKNETMNESQLRRFIQHFERITESNITVLPDIADVVLELGSNHDVVRSRYELH